MAAFTSVTSGNWNDGATWGHTSPGSKGTDWPGNTGDTFVVAAGHTVTYNVSETNELGASTINGLLTFAIVANTKLTFGHVDLTVANGGELRIGTTAGGAIVGASYTAELLWNTTSDNAKGLVISNGGKFTAAGDPALYGSDEETYLAADWTSSSTFTTTDDMSAKWTNGQSILIHKNALYSNYLTDTFPATISGISGTSITINQAFPGGTFKSGGYIGIVTRNVKIGKYHVVAEPIPINNAGSLYVFTNRPYITDNNFPASNFNISDIMITAMSRFNYLNNPIVTRTIIRYCNQSFFSTKRASISNGIAYANNQIYSNESNLISSMLSIANAFSLIGGYNITLNNNIVGNNIGIVGGVSNVIVNGKVYSNRYGLEGTTNIILNGDCYYNQYGIGYTDVRITSNIRVNGGMGYNVTTLAANTNDVSMIGFMDCLFVNVKTATPSIYQKNVSGYYGRIKYSLFNQTIGDDRVYDCFGTILRKTADGSGSLPNARSSANDQICEITTETNCSAINPLLIINPDKHRYYCQAGQQKTIRYYFQLDGTASAIVDGDRLASTPVNGITLELSWLNGVTNSSRTTTISTNHIAPRTGASDWSQYLEVTVTPQVTGYIYAAVYLMTDIGVGKYLWCDPLGKEIAEVPLSYSLIWADGETQIAQMDQTVPWLVADAVWDEARTDHTAAGSFGQGAASVQGNVTGSVGSVSGLTASNLDAKVSDIPALVYEEDTTIHNTENTFGKLFNSLKTIPSRVFRRIS